MLPSKGYFSGIPCVFFSDGSCSRPYCHYRHSYQDVVSGNSGQQTSNSRTMKLLSDPMQSNPEPSDLGAALNCWSPAQVNLVTKLVENAVDKALRSDTTETSRIPRNTLVRNTLNKLFTDPEALKMASSRKFPRKGEPVPSYKPTPISKLTTGHIPVLCVPEKPYPSLIKTRPQRNHPYLSKNPIQKPPKNVPSTKMAKSSNDSEFEFTDSDFFQDHFPTVSNFEPEGLTKFDGTNPKFESKSDFVEGTHKNGTASKYDHRHYTQQKTFALRCRIPLKRLAGLDFEKLNFNTNGQRFTTNATQKRETESSKKKLKLSYNESSPETIDSDQFTETNEVIHRTPVGSLPQVQHIMLEKSQVSAVSVAADNARKSAMNGIRIINEQNDQYDGEPQAKKKKSESISLQVSSSADPFSRWMKNKKIRQILGKDKKAKDSSKKSTFPCSTLFHAQENLSTSKTKVVAMEEELPEPKTAKRIAHKREQLRPVPISAEEMKIPSAFRNHFCTAFFEEFKNTLTLDEAKRKAVEEEFKLAKNAKTVKTYRNNCSLLIVKFRRGDVEDAEAIQEHWTPASCPDFTYGWSLYQTFQNYLLSESELRENGFPLAVPGKPNYAYVDKSSRRYSVQQSEKPFHKICAHCSVKFQVDGNGMPTTKDDCFYHWGKLRRVQHKGQMVDKFTCCGGSVDSAPCEFSVYHVWSGRNEDCMEDFVETKKLPSYMESHEAGIYALDCEMCYTTKGLELARLTVLDLNGRAVFDQVISLRNPILNYCTRFSGIDAAKMASATYTFDDVRRWISEHFFDKTILVGHSLENDLKVLRLIHRTIVDTSLTFPHKYGPPNKMSLKHLASVVLELNIQDNVDGHDSKEDAATCLKLMMKKITEDSKARKPRVIIGYHGKKK